MAHGREAHLTIVTKLVDEMRRQDSVQTSVIEPNKILHGKSGTSHQIDVYWEFMAGARRTNAHRSKTLDKPSVEESSAGSVPC